jgi:hypothetical protein
MINVFGDEELKLLDEVSATKSFRDKLLEQNVFKRGRSCSHIFNVMYFLRKVCVSPLRTFEPTDRFLQNFTEQIGVPERL